MNWRNVPEDFILVQRERLEGGVHNLVFLQQIQELLKDFLNSRNAIKILDLGCAAGYTYLIFKEKCSKYIGIEISKPLVSEGIDYFAAEIQSGMVCLIHGDFLDDSLLEGLPKYTYDLVFVNTVLEHLPSYEETISKAARFINQSGRLVIRTPTSDLPDSIQLVPIFYEWGVCDKLYYNEYNLPKLIEYIKQQGLAVAHFSDKYTADNPKLIQIGNNEFLKRRFTILIAERTE